MSTKSIKKKIEARKKKLRAIQIEHSELVGKFTILGNEIKVKSDQYQKAESKLRELFEQQEVERLNNEPETI